jgi:hypothetical protein
MIESVRRKIGILTIHHHENDGSVMQAYCVKKLLESARPDAFFEYANIFPSGHAVRARQFIKRLLLGKLSPTRAWAAIQRTRSFEKFFRVFLQPQGPTLITNDTGTGVRYLEAQGYSGVVLGSDTVWELGNRWCGLPPPPNYYFTPGLDSAIRSVCFAVSCDPIGATFPEDVDRDSLEVALKRHSFITYRDEPTRKLLIELGVSPEKLAFMPDPTLVWDFSGLVQDFSLPEAIINPVGVAIDSATVRATVSASVRDADGEVIPLLGRVDGARWTQAASLTVNQRLGLFKCLNLLITDRFHSSIFTLKLSAGRIPVIGIEDEEKWPLPNSKLRDLYQRLDIEDFVFRPRSQPITKELLTDVVDRWPAAGQRVRHNLARLEQAGGSMLDKIVSFI